MGSIRDLGRTWRLLHHGSALASALAGAVALACSGTSEPSLALPGRSPGAVPPTPSRTSAAPAKAAPAIAAGATGVREGAGGAGVCPADMVYIDTSYCPEVKLHCIKEEYDKPNHITICHEFAPGQVCRGKPRRQRFCMDRYEYPNQVGAHPPVMVDWYDAAGACGALGKRLCWESEWVSACEGPEKLPFPYGLKRDPLKCNIDNAWLKPDLKKIYAVDATLSGSELLRLDQSVPSGAKEGCASGFGVHDLTGNLDEWVNAERTYEKSLWAGLKGGAWGHVRNACRPMTTSHPPEFTYYFISFRCCADAARDPDVEGDSTLWTPPPQPNHRDPSGAISPGWTPRERGPNQPKVP